VAREYVDGLRQSDLQDFNPRLSEMRALAIGLMAAESLAALHNRGIYHGHVHPQKLMITKAKKVKLRGIGVPGLHRKLLGDVAPHLLIENGLAYYLAPEQFDDLSYADARTDIYSLGATLYRMATGMVPYKGRNLATLRRMHQKGALIPPHDAADGISAQVSSLICRMMAHNPAHRPENVLEIAAGIDRSLETSHDEVSGSNASSRIVIELKTILSGEHPLRD
jgi:serine/threonine-protein kinase